MVLPWSARKPEPRPRSKTELRRSVPVSSPKRQSRRHSPGSGISKRHYWSFSALMATCSNSEWLLTARLARSPASRRRSLHRTTRRRSAWRREQQSRAIGRSGIVGSVWPRIRPGIGADRRPPSRTLIPGAAATPQQPRFSSASSAAQPQHDQQQPAQRSRNALVVVALLPPDGLLRFGLYPSEKVLDLKGG